MQRARGARRLEGLGERGGLKGAGVQRARGARRLEGLGERGGLKGSESAEGRSRRCGDAAMEIGDFIVLAPSRKHRALSALCCWSPSPSTPVPATDSICFERGGDWIHGACVAGSPDFTVTVQAHGPCRCHAADVYRPWPWMTGASLGLGFAQVMQVKAFPNVGAHIKSVRAC